MSVRRILVIGSGGREHALAWRLSRDPERPQVRVAPGNPGIAARFDCLPIDGANPEAVLAAARAYAIDLIVVGPEVPLAAGLADVLESAGIPTFGPSGEAARLESSKWFAKQVMSEARVPTARAEAFDDVHAAREALPRFGPPWVIKADGLAAGKGVRVTGDRREAEDFLADCFTRRRFGAGGSRVVLEEFLAGEEASVMAVCDGNHALLLPAARDYKRAFDSNRGPNTGGMGALAPHPGVGPALESEIERRIVSPLLGRMRERGTPFRGLLYCGLMLTGTGPRVIEFNVRFGDPEAQVVLPLLEGSLSELLLGASRGALDAGAVSRAPGAAVAIALTDAGYPDSTAGAGTIVGLEGLESDRNVEIFHAATAPSPGGWRVTGGRAAYVIGRGADLSEARAAAYRAVDRLSGTGWRARRDIAADVGASNATTRGA